MMFSNCLKKLVIVNAIIIAYLPGQICAVDKTEESWLERIKNEVSLVDVALNSDATLAIHAWMTGETSGIKCIKDVMHATVVAGAATVGGAVGYVIAGELGRSIGRWIGKTIMEFIVDFLTQWLFGRPKNEALKNAYDYLGVGETASRGEINRAYRELALKHNPDRGGSVQNFYILQFAMAVIKEAREGVFDLVLDMFRFW